MNSQKLKISEKAYFPANEEDGVNLLFISPFSYMWRKMNKKRKNKIQIILESVKGHIKWCADRQVYQKFGAEILAGVINKPSYIKNLKKQIKIVSDDLIAWSKKLQAADLKKMADAGLAGLIKQHRQKVFKIMLFGLEPAVMELSNNLLTNYLLELLEQQRKTVSVNKPVIEYFHILTEFDFNDAARKEKIDLLKIASQVKSKRDLNKDKITKLIKSHTAEYFWLNYAYQGPILTTEYFTNRLKIELKTGNIKNRLNDLLKRSKKIISQRKNAEKELKLNAKQKYLFTAARDCIFIKLYRKDALTFSLAVMEKTLKEISHRTGYSLKQIRQCLAEEVPLLFKSSELKIELDKRYEHNVFYLQNNDPKKPVILIGQKAKAFMGKVLIFEQHGNTQEFSGSVACSGCAQGKVKIINSYKDMAKMKKGDILVSIATIPEIVPAMKKAAAIVTDLGGITSHAAIVARELKIPCVIGTGKATKVLKDGDLVEVDAIEGVIKILKS